MLKWQLYRPKCAEISFMLSLNFIQWSRKGVSCLIQCNVYFFYSAATSLLDSSSGFTFRLNNNWNFSRQNLHVFFSLQSSGFTKHAVSLWSFQYPLSNLCCWSRIVCCMLALASSKSGLSFNACWKSLLASSKKPARSFKNKKLCISRTCKCAAKLDC